MHKTVLLNEAIDNLNIKEDGIYVDATLGFGGHSGLILKRVKRGFLFAFDQDEMAIEYSEKKLAEIGSNYEIIKSNFANLKEELGKRNINKIDGIVFDLGVSSHQLDTAERGFSYMQDAPLDMRMDQQARLSAYDVVNSYDEAELNRIFKEYGEERWSKRIAQFIVEARKNAPVETTGELVDIIKRAVPAAVRNAKGGHPAKRIFQAIRIEVNDELGILENAFRTAVAHLKPGGRIAIITFHSLEDRIAKNVLREMAKGCICPPELPICTCGHKPEIKLLVKGTAASKEELEHNSRSKSAKLRIAEKL